MERVWKAAAVLAVLIVVVVGLMIWIGPEPKTSVDTSNYTPAQLRGVKVCYDDAMYDWLGGSWDAKELNPSLDGCVREAGKL